MQKKLLMPLAVIAVAAAVIVVAVAMVLVNERRAENARRQLAIAQSREETAREAAKVAASEEAAAAAKLAEQEVRLETALVESNNVAMAVLEGEGAIARERAERERIEKEIELADLIAEAKSYESEAIAKTAEVERVRLEQLKLQAEVTNRIAKIAADRAVEAVAAKEKIEAENKAKAALKLDFEEWERRLREWERNLEEREEMLKPEKTVADLLIRSDDEDEGQTNAVTAAKKAQAENDPHLTTAGRELAKLERQLKEQAAERKEQRREARKAWLDGLRTNAVKEARIVDAQYYERLMKEL